MKKYSESTRIIIHKLWDLIVFIILLAIANILATIIHNNYYIGAVQFFNSNLISVIIIIFISMINALVWNFYFPFNLISPLVSAIFCVNIIKFIYTLWIFINTRYLGLSLAISIQSVYTLAIILTIILGYLILATKPKKSFIEFQKNMHKTIKKEKINWNDFENEFKMIFYNIINNTRKLFKIKNKKNISKRV